MSIVLCIPVMHEHPKHGAHMLEWYAHNKPLHDLRLVRTYRKPLAQAQDLAVEAAREIGASHVLFTEDDHWGYPIDGLEVLLECDKDVIGFKSYSRHYPYLSFFMQKRDRHLSAIGREVPNMMSIEAADGDIAPVDLLTWAFTLVKTEVFDRIPPFRQATHINPTDSHFCQWCEDVGIERWGHFGFTIAHGDFGPEEIAERRQVHEALHGKPMPETLQVAV